MPRMPKNRPQKGLIKLHSKSSKKRRTGATLWIALGSIFVLVGCVYVNLSFQGFESQERYDANQQRKGGSATSDKNNKPFAKGPSATDTQPEDRVLQNRQPKVVKTPVPNDKLTTTLSIFGSGHCQGKPIQEATALSSHLIEAAPTTFPKSVLLQGSGLAEVYVGANYEYKGTVMEVEGCVDFYNLYKDEKKQIKFKVYSAASTDKVLTAKRQTFPQLQEKFATTKDLAKPHTRIVFSATSSQYFGYQIFANALGFLRSNQTNASWLRLLSAGQQDDLSERFPTFTAPKSLYNVFYQPINKADVIDKWFHSKDAPHPDDTIVVIDPDNWLTNSVHKWTTRVFAKQALGQRAYYSGNPKLQQLWKDVCLNNCHIPIDPVGVPYVLKGSDLKDVAPLWRDYSIKIKEKFKDNTTFADIYGPALGVRWAAEMFGYNAACTHLRIKTAIVSDMQMRDVDGGKRNWAHLQKEMPMLHMGRAWFPKEKADLAAPWRHKLNNEPGSVAASGIEVWCKCNNTAPDVLPWPLPDNMDWVSYHTLTLLHDSVQEFGPVPHNETFRRTKPVFYAWAVP